MFRLFHHWHFYRLSNRDLYRLAIASFLYALSSGIFGFIFPLVIHTTVSTLSLVGFIIAFSSAGNITTDLVMSGMKKPPSYFLLIQGIVGCLTVIYLSLWFLPVLPVLIGVSFLWGVYTELYRFAIFNYILTISDEGSQGGQFGILNNFLSLGFVVAPVIAGTTFLLDRTVAFAAGLFFALGLFLFFNLQYLMGRLPKSLPVTKRQSSMLEELKLWSKIGKKIYPILIVYFSLGIVYGAVASYATIWVESSRLLKPVAGLVIASLSLPLVVLCGWFGKLGDRWGRKRFILAGLLLIGFGISVFGLSTLPILIFSAALVYGVGQSVVTAPLMAEQSAYIEHHHREEQEVVGESGAVKNVGFIVGAMISGFLVNRFGFGIAFIIFGIIQWVSLVLYWMFSPKYFSIQDGR